MNAPLLEGLHPRTATPPRVDDLSPVTHFAIALMDRLIRDLASTPRVRRQALADWRGDVRPYFDLMSPQAARLCRLHIEIAIHDPHAVRQRLRRNLRGTTLAADNR